MNAEIFLLEYIRRRKNWDTVLAWLDEFLFHDEATLAVYRAIKKGHKFGDVKSVDYPQISALVEETEKDPEVWGDARKVCKQMAKVRHRLEVVQDMSKRMLVKRHTLALLKDTADDIGSNKDINIGKLKIALSKLECIGESDGVTVDLLDHPEQHFQDILAVDEAVPTPVPALTKALDGGPGAGELTTIIGLPDGGKTLMLLDVAVTSIENGFPTFVAVLERGRVCISRLYCRITDHTAKWLSKHEGAFKKILRKRSDENAPIRMMDYSRKEVSVSDLRRDISRFVDDVGNVGCVVIDYGDLLRSSRRYEAKRHELDTVWQELARLAQEFGCPVWTGTQSNRAGGRVSRVEMVHVAEAWAKMGTTDMVITINRNEREKQRERARLFVAKTKKTGGSIVIPVQMDRLRCRLKSLGETHGDKPRKTSRNKEQKKEVPKRNRNEAVVRSVRMANAKANHRRRTR
jgi:replicative DNA helicase